MLGFLYTSFLGIQKVKVTCQLTARKNYFRLVTLIRHILSKSPHKEVL